MSEITREMLEAERASLVAQRDEAERRARTADGAIQMVDALLAVLAAPESSSRVLRAVGDA